MVADQHPDVEHLDAYAEGDHSPSGVALHVGTCPQCRETVTALRQVRRDLAALASVTMPADVAERLRAALISEQDGQHRNGQHRDGQHPAVGRPAPSESWRPGRIPGRTGDRRYGGARLARPPGIPAWFTAAACLIVVVGMVSFVVALAHHPAQSTASEASSQLAAPLPAPAAGPLTAQAPRAPAGERSAGEATPGTVADTAEGAILAHTGYPVTMAEIPQHALDLVTGRIPGTLRISLHEYGAATTYSSAAVASVITEMTQPDLRLCYVNLAAQTGGSIVALDLVTFNGQPAVLVVLSSPNDTDQLQVAVLDERCNVTNMAAALWYSTTTTR